MSLKNVAFAFASMLVVSGPAFAGDLMDDLKTMDLDSIVDAGAELEAFDLDGLDVDQMAEEAGDESDAIEACFRRFGGHRGFGRGWGRWGGFRSYGHGFGRVGRFGGYAYSCYRPLYSYRSFSSCYSHCYPVISNYWGCH